jgi:hypothetical protein
MDSRVIYQEDSPMSANPQPPYFRRLLNFGLFTLPAALVACTAGILTIAPPVTGSGVIRTEPRPIAGVRAVQFAGIGELDIRQGPAESLSVEADDNILPLIETNVHGDTLTIGTKPGIGQLRPHLLRYHLVVQDLRALAGSGSGSTTMPALETSELKLALSGSGSISLDQLQTRSLTLDVSGSGQLQLHQLHTDTLVASLSGSGKMDLDGQALDQSIVISGSGQYAAAALLSKASQVTISGSGVVRVACADSLTAAISGSGNISYTGSPKVDSRLSGSGRIQQVAP